MKKYYMNWEEYDKCLDEMAEWVLDNFYNMNLQQLEVGAINGVPRGGLPIAVSLSHRLGIPIILDYEQQYPPTGVLLVVDDIADTGHTLKDFDKEKNNVICTLHYNKKSITTPHFFCIDNNDKWIVYPWERKDSETIADYLKQEEV